MNSPISEIARTVSLREISGGTWELTVWAPKIAAICQAGQFVHVRIADYFQPFLRRPLSIGPPPILGSRTEETLRLIFTVRGEGTRLLTLKQQKDDPVDLIGPLGKPFILPEGKAILIAGGIGVVPLLMLDEKLPVSTKRQFLLGVRSKDNMTVNVPEIGYRQISVSSDDGSIGFHGNVVELFKQKLTELEGEKLTVYACGPGVMLAPLKEICISRGIQLYVSLEVSMGCGVGACQSCAVPNANGNGYSLVCSDGPVFDARDVDLKPETLP